MPPTKDLVRLRHMLEYARETMTIFQARSRQDLDSDRLLGFISINNGLQRII